MRPRPAGFEPQSQERLLAYDGSTALLSVLRRHRRRGRIRRRPTEDAAWLFRSGTRPRLLPLAQGERVIAVAGDRVLVASRTHARWLASDDDPATAAGDPVVLDEQSYALEVEPYAWQLLPGFAVQACSPTRLLLSASGPAGIVVVAVEWPARG